jgi:ubiquitin C-terminal hydrolase
MNIVGLQNCGNSCYLNSAIQSLHEIKEYRDRILGYKINKNNKEHNFISIIKKIFKLMEQSDKYVSENKICPLFEKIHKEQMMRKEYLAKLQTEKFAEKNKTVLASFLQLR